MFQHSGSKILFLISAILDFDNTGTIQITETVQNRRLRIKTIEPN